MARPKQRADLAQQDFFLAAYNLYERGEPRNPLQSLLTETFKAWERAKYPKRSSSSGFTYGYPSSLESCQREAAAQEVLAVWARRNNLTGDGPRRAEPLSWIVQYAQQLCEKKHWNTFQERTGGSSDSKVTHRTDLTDLPKFPKMPFLMIPIEDPPTNDIESRLEFRRRVRRAVRVFLQDSDKTSKCLPKLNRMTPSKEPELQSFEMLILRRCCLVQPKDIYKRYYKNGHRSENPSSSVINAIKPKESLLGFTPFRLDRKKLSPK